MIITKGHMHMQDFPIGKEELIKLAQKILTEDEASALHQLCPAISLCQSNPRSNEKDKRQI
jgi:hypothetical protein